MIMDKLKEVYPGKTFEKDWLKAKVVAIATSL
jgi:hypothetical protein